MVDLISVIVPVYRVEDYLDKCVTSIVSQTYRHLEIVLVDDGSPDKCGVMCDEWAAKDSRVRVVHKKNGGLSDARNAGMDIANGDYIAFVDSDDWIHPCFIESMHRAAKEHDAQMVACGVRFVYSEADEEQAKEIAPSVRFTAEEALGTLIRGEGFRAVAWNKLYHRSLVETERFLVGKYHEDEYFTYKVIGKATALAFIETEMYYYLQRGSGIMGSVSPKHLEALDAYRERLEYFRSRYPRIYEKDAITFCVMCVNFYKMALSFGEEDRSSALSSIKRYRKNVTITWSQWCSCGLKDKIYLLLGGSCMGLFCRVLLMKEGGAK